MIELPALISSIADGDYLISPLPKTFLGIRAGYSNYADAEKLWGQAEHIMGGRPSGGRRIVFDNGSEFGYEGFDHRLHGREAQKCYWIDGLELRFAAKPVPAWVFRKERALNFLKDLTTALTDTECEAAFAKHHFKLVPAPENLTMDSLVITFVDHHPAKITYARGL